MGPVCSMKSGPAGDPAVASMSRHLRIQGADKMTARPKADPPPEPSAPGRNVLAASHAALLNRLKCLAVPYAWFKTIRDHTAIVLLADILSVYTGQQVEWPVLWDGDELLLLYKEVADRLGVSDRTISRAVSLLVAREALRYERRDRRLNGTPTRNVVGVVPNLEVVAELSGIALGDILSAQVTAPTPPRKAGRIPLATTPPTAEPVSLTDFQESLVRAYQDDFEQVVGKRYRTSLAQKLADLKAVASVTVPKERGSGRKYPGVGAAIYGSTQGQGGPPAR